MGSEVKGRLDRIKLTAIGASPIALRDPKTDDPKFKELAVSVEKDGVLKPILVNDNGDGSYTLVDGLQRYTAAKMVFEKDTTRDTIPANIISVDSERELEIQIMLNNNTVRTTPSEFAKGLQRVLTNNPGMTAAQLAERIGVSIATVINTLNLTNIHPDIKDLVDKGEMRVTNAYQLGKLNHEDQLKYLDEALTDSPEIFTPKVAARLKEIREAAKGNKSEPSGPPMRVRKMPEVRERYESLSTNNNLSPNEIGQLNALAWVLNQDPESKAAWEKETKERELKAAQEKAAKKAKDAEEASKKAAEIRAKALSN